MYFPFSNFKIDPSFTFSGKSDIGILIYSPVCLFSQIANSPSNLSIENVALVLFIYSFNSFENELLFTLLLFLC